jgi:Bacterial SH3 domain
MIRWLHRREGKRGTIAMLTIFRTVLFAGAILAASSAVHAAPAKQFPPKDECLSIDGYFDLRQKFEDIVKRRDAKAFLAMTAPTISWTFGEDGGKDAFAKHWKLETGKASPIWAELDKIVRLGCFSQGPDNPTMPHFFGQDTGAAGVAEASLVLGPAVNLREQPSTASKSITKINWEVVKPLSASPDGKWSKVQTADGKTGYIRNDYLRLDVDYRIGFERKDAGWVISFFIAGD